MSDRILVGVDGSEGSRVALRWAAEAGARLGLRVVALGAWQYPADTVLQVGRVQLADPAAVDQAVEQQTRAFVADTLGGAGAAVLVRAGRGPAAGVLLQAADDHVAMTVVGSRGLGGFKGLLLGSVSRQVCEHARHPVVVVPASTRVLPVRLATIVVGIDGSPGAARAVEWAAWPADTAGAKVVAVHLMPALLGPGDAADRVRTRQSVVERWCQPFRDVEVAYRVTMTAGDPRSALLTVAEQEDTDLVVVGARGRGAVDRLLLGSVAVSLTQLSRQPVAVVPHPRRTGKGTES
jgi:nucleotide-binding universal stress UspA family protein